MRRMTCIFLSVMFFAIVGVFCCCSDTFANDYIKAAWVKGNSGIDSDGGTTFSIGMTFHEKCSSSTCQQDGKFRCTSPGKAYTTCINNNKTKVSKDSNKSNAEWTYYKVSLFPCSSSQQAISGYIRKKNSYTLTVQEKNIYNNSNLDNYEATTGYGWKIASRYAKTGYKFVGWNFKEDGQTLMTSGGRLSASSIKPSDGCANSGYNVCSYKGSKANTMSGGHNVYTKVLANLTENRKVYAYFAEIYKLTISVGSGTSVTVNRTSTKYGPSTGKVKNGSSIYKGDKLHICVGTKTDYENPVLQIKSGSGSYNGKTLNSEGCYDYEVNNNTYIKTSASLKKKDEGFVGLSRVADAYNNSDNEDTGWTQSDAEVRDYVINCNFEEGCPVVIAHYLKRVSGSGQPRSVTYDDSERSKSANNGSGVEDGIPCYKSNGTCVKNGSDNGAPGNLSAAANGSGVVVRRMMYILKPGQKICETMSFTPFRNKSDTASLTVCAYAVGSASTDLSMEIKNSSVPKYSSYTNGPVYAKPGDEVYYKAIYNPGVQNAYYLVPEGLRINSGAVHLNPDRVDSRNSVIRHLGFDYVGVTSMFNEYKGDTLKDWHNGFSMQISNDSFETTKVFHNRDPFTGEYDAPYRGYSYMKGHAEERTEEYIYNKTGNSLGDGVAESDVGKVIVGRSLTNLEGSVSETTPSKVTFEMEDGYDIGNVETDSVKSNDVSAIVPYNFRLATDVDTEKRIVYAGEQSNIAYGVTVQDKYNGLLDSTYATIVRDGIQRTRVCEDYGMTINCRNYYDDFGRNNVWKKGDNLNEKTTIDIPDVPAGTKLYVRSEVYPADSGPDDNLNLGICDFNSIECWAKSETKELIVAKKPSFQVWGGSVHSAGDITEKEVLLAEKSTLRGYNDDYDNSSEYEEQLQDQSEGHFEASANPVYTFGSWVELDLVARGAVKGLASGAGLGYAYTADANRAQTGDGKTNIEGLGGSSSADFCKMSTLSFANSNCKTSVGNLASLGFGNAGSDKSVLIMDLMQDKNGHEDKGFDIPASSGFDLSVNDENHCIDDKKICYYVDSDKNRTVMLGALSGIDSGITKVVRVDGNIKIANDIEYKDRVGGNIELNDVPKVIMYAGGNIEIQCEVKRIDAVLIAEGDIKTCNSNNVNDSTRSIQLKINGATISDTLTLGRTYGAATGTNSIIPAEIINYDTSLYLWANKWMDVTETGKLTESTIRELAPRY